MNYKKLAIYISLLLSFILFFLYLYSGTIINSFLIKDNSKYESHLAAKAEICLEEFRSTSYLFTSDQKINNAILNCDPIFMSETHSLKFPSQMRVDLESLNPVIKVTKENGEGCILYEEINKFAELDAERCISFHPVPEVTGTNLSFIILIESLSNKNEIEVIKIIEKGDNSFWWYELKLASGKTVLIPQGDELQNKLAQLKASIYGLNEAEEKYKQIDLRFDRVVYR